MTLRLKIVTALVLLAMGATVTISVWTYASTAHRLRADVDRSLNDAAARLLGRGSGAVDVDGDHDGTGGDDSGGLGLGPFGPRPRSFEQILVQLLAPSGTRVAARGTAQLPADDTDTSLARSSTAVSKRRDVRIDGERYRMLTVAIGSGGGAVQFARSLAEGDRFLSAILRRTAIASLVVIAAAAAAGWLIARQMTRRLVRLTTTAEHVALTGELAVSVPVTGADETGRLGTAFNEMLAALARSKDDQQRLVQDAGHELRTPLTSLRTNIDVLRRYDQLPPAMKERVLGDLDSEARELTALVNELVELATERRSDEPTQPVALAEIARRVAERTHRRTGRPVVLDADDTVVTGRPGAIERAMSNLLDNAAKFDGTGQAPIELIVAAGRVEVRDRGPGFGFEDVPHLFDRFYRATAARSLPGSGLGLAIVRDVAESHGGTVFAQPRPGGGAIVGFTLP